MEKNVGFIHQIIADSDFPGWSSGKYGMQVQSLDWELRSHMPWSNYDHLFQSPHAATRESVPRKERSRMTLKILRAAPKDLTQQKK